MIVVPCLQRASGLQIRLRIQEHVCYFPRLLRPAPVNGIKLVQIPFTKTSTGNYELVAPADSVNAYTDIWWNQNITNCSQIECFRPVSIVMDSADRTYVTSGAAVEGGGWLVGKV
jgi:hypothetical protein